jgi:hypothetical protein
MRGAISFGTVIFAGMMALAQPSGKTPPPLLDPASDKLPAPEKFADNDPAKKSDKVYDVYMVAAAAEGNRAAGPEVGIGFFNHSKREVTVVINNREVKLGVGYYVQVKLPRDFKWREKDGPENATIVPKEFEGAEIVFRK